MDPQPLPYWSQNTLVKKIGLWTSDQIKYFSQMLDLKPNEHIYDIGSGFSPLGTQIIPFILPNGSVTGFDIDNQTVALANEYSISQNISKYITFKELDVYTIDEQQLPLADVLMCQQLLVNLADPITALERMVNVCKSTGRIFCLENINYGAYVYRPDFSSKTNFELSQIWQSLITVGKQGYDFGDTTFGANLPEVFHKLGLHDISWQILSTGVNLKPPYSEEFKKSFLENNKTDKERIKSLVLTSWGPKTEISKDKLQFFVEQVITSDYDEYAIENDLFLTQWYYPFMACVGWLQPKEKKVYSENVSLDF